MVCDKCGIDHAARRAARVTPTPVAPITPWARRALENNLPVAISGVPRANVIMRPHQEVR